MTLEDAGTDDRPLTAENVNTPVNEPEGDATPPVETPQVAPEPPAPEPKADTTPEPKVETPKVEEIDYSKLDMDELLKRDDFRAKVLKSEEVTRAIQSEKDKEIAREKRRMAEERTRRENELKTQQEEERRRKLLDEEDYESLGREQAKTLQDADEAMRYGRQFSGALEKLIRERSDYVNVLGEDGIDQIFREVEGDRDPERRNIFEAHARVAEAVSQRLVDRAKNEAEMNIDKKLDEMLEAKLADAGVKSRTERVAAGDAPVEGVSGSGTPKGTSTITTWEQAADAFNAGEMTWDEYKPFREEHDKERKRR